MKQKNCDIYYQFLPLNLLDNCVDTDENVKDNAGNSCSDYLPSWCGRFDHMSFLSNRMCCACGGGKGKL